MQGNYDEIVTDKLKWLNDCSVKFYPVKCSDVWSGSIVLQLRGEEDAVRASESEILEQGLILDGWPALYAEEPKRVKNEETKKAGFPAWAIVAIAVGLLIILAVAVHYSYKQQLQKTPKVDRKQPLPGVHTQYERIVKDEGSASLPKKRTSFALDEENKDSKECNVKILVTDEPSVEKKPKWKPNVPAMEDTKVEVESKQTTNSI